jgi:hypothetical protein
MSDCCEKCDEPSGSDATELVIYYCSTVFYVSDSGLSIETGSSLSYNLLLLRMNGELMAVRKAKIKLCQI